jgi:hypothetical protein
MNGALSCYLWECESESWNFRFSSGSEAASFPSSMPRSSKIRFDENKAEAQFIRFRTPKAGSQSAESNRRCTPMDADKNEPALICFHPRLHPRFPIIGKYGKGSFQSLEEFACPASSGFSPD